MSFSGLFIGASAIRTSAVALDTIGHNISNAATEGYTRQRVAAEASPAAWHTYGMVGTGSNIIGVEQISSNYLESQIRKAYTTEQYLSTLQSGYGNLQVIFNELTDGDISSAMDEFWSAAEDLSAMVEDTSSRSSFLESASSLSAMFNNMSAKLIEYRGTLNDNVPTIVNDVNTITSQIAKLNQDIVKDESAGVTGVSSNDLRDNRTRLLKELSGIMDVTIITEDNGSITVSQKGRLLVYQDKNYELATERELSGDTLVYNVVYASDSDSVDLGGGSLAATLEMRDTTIPSFQDELDELAASMIWNVNRTVSQGTGLDGYTELTGTSSVRDTSLTLDKIKYVFDTVPGTYEIENGYFEVLVTDPESGQVQTAQVNVDLDDSTAEPDTILYDPTNPAAANSLVVKMQAAFDSIAQGAFTVSVTNSNRLQITANTDTYTFGFGTDTSGTLAALGLNTVFTGSGADDIAVNELMTNDPEFLGMGKGFVAGDNTTCLEMIDLRNSDLMNNGSASFEDFYQASVGRLGVEASHIDTAYVSQVDLLTNYENQRESLSGVNTDEELTKLIQWQRSYQAASKFISVMDELYQTLINM